MNGMADLVLFTFLNYLRLELMFQFCSLNLVLNSFVSWVGFFFWGVGGGLIGCLKEREKELPPIYIPLKRIKRKKLPSTSMGIFVFHRQNFSVFRREQ